MIEGRMMSLYKGFCKKRKEKTETLKFVINGIYQVPILEKDGLLFLCTDQIRSV